MEAAQERVDQYLPTRFQGKVSFTVSEHPLTHDGFKFPGFTIEVTDGKSAWHVRKRYCDFQALNLALPHDHTQPRLSLPPVRVQFNGNDKVAHNRQMQNLQMYLDRLALHPVCETSHLVWEFFDPHHQRNLWESLSCPTKYAIPQPCMSMPAATHQSLRQTAADMEWELANSSSGMLWQRSGSPTSSVSTSTTSLVGLLLSPKAAGVPGVPGAAPGSSFSPLHKRAGSSETNSSSWSMDSVDSGALCHPFSGAATAPLSTTPHLLSPPATPRPNSMCQQLEPGHVPTSRYPSFTEEILPDLLS